MNMVGDCAGGDSQLSSDLFCGLMFDVTQPEDLTAFRRQRHHSVIYFIPKILCVQMAYRVIVLRIAIETGQRDYYFVTLKSSI